MTLPGLSTALDIALPTAPRRDAFPTWGFSLPSAWMMRMIGRQREGS